MLSLLCCNTYGTYCSLSWTFDLFKFTFSECLRWVGCIAPWCKPLTGNPGDCLLNQGAWSFIPRKTRSGQCKIGSKHFTVELPARDINFAVFTRLDVIIPWLWYYSWKCYTRYFIRCTYVPISLRRSVSRTIKYIYFKTRKQLSN